MAADTREKILASALELFAEEGYDKTTMRAIADRSGMSLGSAYYYFRSKDELMQGFYAQLFDSFSGLVEPALVGKQSFTERLEITLTTWVGNAASVSRVLVELLPFCRRPEEPAIAIFP